MTISRIIGFIISLAALTAVVIANVGCTPTIKANNGCGGQAKPVYKIR